MRLIINKLAAIVFCCICLAAVESQAHFMWLNAHDYTPTEDRKATFTVGWGHAFYNPAGDILVGNDILDEIYMIEPSGDKMEVAALNNFQYESSGKLSEGSYLAMVKRKEGFSTKTAKGYKRQSKKGLKDVVHSRYLGMYGKAILNVGDGGGETITKPAGIPLEIVPTVDPSELKAGDYFTFELLYDGKPVAEYVNATYVGFSHDNAWAYSTRTDSKGKGEIKILESGIWVLKANHKAPYPDPDEADEYSYTTSLTFEVR